MSTCVQSVHRPQLLACRVSKPVNVRCSASIGAGISGKSLLRRSDKSLLVKNGLFHSSESRNLQSTGFEFSLKADSVNHSTSRDFRVRGVQSDSDYDEDDPEEQKRRSLVAKRLESTARYFRRLGSLGFWIQLVCTVVAAVIFVFSIVVTGAATAPVTTYLTSGGIAAGFLSVFWSYGYMRLANRLRSAVDNPMKAPPRANVVDNLKNGLIINLVGSALSLFGLQATVGVLVAKALTSSYSPFLQGTPAGYSPVLALDVFLVQACANALLSHFVGSVISLELLRATTLQQPPPDNVVPSPA